MSKVIFLLGAGVSKEAGLPLMADLTTGFLDWVKTAEVDDREADSRLFSAAVNAVSAGAPPNIEHVLSLLSSVSSSKQGAEAKTVAKWQSPFDEPSEHLTQLASDIRIYIGDRLRGVNPKAAEYLSGLLDFHNSDEPLDVFTMNYDRLVESTAARMGVRFTTGFGDVWDPDLFTVATRWDMRVFKLHGSIDWYRLPNRSLVFQGMQEHYAFPGEQTVEVLLYPAEGKEAYADPYATLMSFFTQSLSQAEFCVAVGYSFRDAHIRRTVLDRMATNPNLQLLVVNPTANEVINLPPEGADEPTFGDFPDRVVGLWVGAKQAFEDRLIGYRLTEVTNSDFALSEVVKCRSRRDFNSAAGQLLEAIELCRDTQLPNKPGRLLRQITGVEFQSAVNVAIRRAANFLARTIRQEAPFTSVGEQQTHIVRGTVQEYFGRLVSLWLMAKWFSFAEEASKIKLLISTIIQNNVRGLLILEEDGYVSWPEEPVPRDDPRLWVTERSEVWRGLERELQDRPSGSFLPLLDKDASREYDALLHGVSALTGLYEVLSIKSMRRIALDGHFVISILSEGEWRMTVLTPLEESPLGKLFAAVEKSRLAALWLPGPTVTGKRVVLATM